MKCCCMVESFTGNHSDILLNVFLAIAVDNLGDADEATEQEEQNGSEHITSAETQVSMEYL